MAFPVTSGFFITVTFIVFIHFYREDIMKKATNIGRENLTCLGTCFGKFTKSGKFKLQITALDFLAPYAKVVL